MRLDREARKGLIWVGLWAIVLVGMVLNDTFEHYPFGASVFFGVFVISVGWWYGSLRDRTRKREHEEALRASGFDEIDEMTGIQFEEYFAAVLAGLGYRVTMTKTTGDFGVDLIAIKDGTRTAVQCKRKGGGAVGGAAVQQVVAGAVMHRCSATMVVTNNQFTRAAQQLAAAHNCELVDRPQLKRLALDASAHMPAQRARFASRQADVDICMGVNGLQDRGEDFYKSCRHLLRTGGNSIVNVPQLGSQLRAVAAIGAPPGEADGSAALEAASSQVRLPLSKVIRDADRLAQRFAEIANGAPASGVDRELTALIHAFIAALVACAKAGYAPSWFDPDDLPTAAKRGTSRRRCVDVNERRRVGRLRL